MILVTGGTGLLGAHLLHDLVRSGKKVRALKREGSSLENVKNTFHYYSDNADGLFSTVEWKNGDVLDIFSLTESMEGVTEVYHCAAKVSFNPKDQAEMLKINIEGTANVINACLERGINKVCHVSSVAALGRPEDNSSTTEETFWKSSPLNSMYSISKYAAEREAWRGVQEGLNVIIVNPSIIVGPGNWNNGSSNMIKSSHKGMRFYTEGLSGFIDVRDVVRSMIELMESEIKNEGFILSSENSSYKRFFELSHDNFKKKRPFLKATKLLGEIAWRMENLRSWVLGSNPLLTKETARAAHAKNHFSSIKIKTILKKEFISLEQSVKDTCDLYLKDLVKKEF